MFFSFMDQLYEKSLPFAYNWNYPDQYPCQRVDDGLFVSISEIKQMLNVIAGNGTKGPYEDAYVTLRKRNATKGIW